MGGLRAVAEQDGWVAVTGAWGRVVLDGAEVDPYSAHAWPAGPNCSVDWFAHGARGYVAVRGGDRATPLVVGSRASDLMAGLGHASAARGRRPAGGSRHRGRPIPVPGIAPWGAPHDEELEIELAPGVRVPTASRPVRSTPCSRSRGWSRTTPTASGMRLDGPVLERAEHGELPSEGMVPGASRCRPADGPRSCSPTAR